MTLGTVGAGSLLYVLVTLGFTHPRSHPGDGLAWPLFGGLPLYLFGLWLLTATTARSAVYLALGATGMAVGAAYEAFVQTQSDVLLEPWFPLFNAIGLTADAVATAGFVLMVATFPDGRMGHRWQRIVTWLIWSVLLVAPLTLLTSPTVVPPTYAGLENLIVTNPYAVSGLEWAAPWVQAVWMNPWVLLVLGLGVFYGRALFGARRTRAQLRVMCLAVTVTLVSFVLWTAVAALGMGATPFSTLLQVVALGSMAALPVAGIHGILRYGAYEVPVDGRGRLVVRSSNTLITALYGVAVGAPAVLLGGRVPLVGTVLLTVGMALALLPVRAWLQRAIRAVVFGDRERHLALLGELGTRLEQAVEVDEVLTRLAEAVRGGLDATWVRVQVVGAAGAREPAAVALVGEVDGEPAAGHDLAVGETRLGRIDLGPRRHGHYGPGELTLLATVARQATTAVSNVRLTAQLAERLDELTASRTRLITAQDVERRRIERDLHDGVQQNVVALIAGLRLARNRLERRVLRPGELAELQEQARETLADLRELAHGIHPQVLTDQGLVSAVESRTVRFPVPLTIHADASVRDARYDADVEAVAFYTVREALTNVAKHARASSAGVDISRSTGSLRVQVRDDGMGFEGNGDNGPTVGGLANIRDRVAAVGGVLRVESQPGAGTCLVADLPLRDHDPSEGRAARPSPEPPGADAPTVPGALERTGA